MKTINIRGKKIKMIRRKKDEDITKSVDIQNIILYKEIENANDLHMAFTKNNKIKILIKDVTKEITALEYIITKWRPEILTSHENGYRVDLIDSLGKKYDHISVRLLLNNYKIYEMIENHVNL